MNRIQTYLFLPVALLILLVAVAVGEKTAKETGMSEQNPSHETATFAGGCFWCLEADMQKLPGVIEAVSGYTGGHIDNPTYEQVSGGETGHVEAVQVHYDPRRVSYEELLDWFWRHVNPTDPGGQFVDRGDQYETAIFYHNEAQKKAAEASKEALAASGRFTKPIVTEIRPAAEFFKAEDYHQDYSKTHAMRYHFYRAHSGRDDFLKAAWKDEKTKTKQNAYTVPPLDELKEKLSPIQYQVTQQDGTEPPFQNEYWDNKKPGIYVDIVSGEPLFSSADKFESGTGWPSFTRPLEPENIVKKEDRSLFMVRTEVRSKHANSHLGHVFQDGPKPAGLRYCINSASLRFIPAADLEKEGYGKYKHLFQ